MKNDNNEIPLTAGLKTGGKFRTTLSLLDAITEEFLKSKVDTIDCPNCSKSFYIFAGFDNSNLRELASQHYNQINDPKETGFDGFLFMTKEEYQEFHERVIPEDNCNWHEELEKL